MTDRRSGIARQLSPPERLRLALLGRRRREELLDYLTRLAEVAPRDVPRVQALLRVLGEQRPLTASLRTATYHHLAPTWGHRAARAATAPSPGAHHPVAAPRAALAAAIGSGRPYRVRASAPAAALSAREPLALSPGVYPHGAGRRAGPRGPAGAVVQFLDGRVEGDLDAEDRRALGQLAQGPLGALPHAAALRRLFPEHDLDSIRAAVGEPARQALRALDAQGVAVGEVVAFAHPPTVAEAAHEVAHVLQSRDPRTAAADQATREAGARAVEALAGQGAPIPPGRFPVHRWHHRPWDLGPAEARARAPLTPRGRTRRVPVAPAPAARRLGPQFKGRRATGGLSGALRALGIRSDKPSTKTAYRFARVALEADDKLRAATLDGTAPRATVLAAARHAWWKARGDSETYLRELATELKDHAALTKLQQLRRESHWGADVPDGPKLVDTYLDAVAARTFDERSPHVTAPRLYDPNGSAFTDEIAAGGKAYLRKGRTVDIPAVQGFLHRTMTAQGFFAYNTTARYRKLWRKRTEALVQPVHRDKIVADATTRTSASKLNVVDYWRYRCATDPTVAAEVAAGLDRASKLGGSHGSTWWSYRGVKLEKFSSLAKTQQVGFEHLINLAALEPKWYARGAIRLKLDAKALEREQKAGRLDKLRKPTALDGMLSPRYKPGQVAATKWGVTAGGDTEAVGPFLPARLLVEGPEAAQPFIPHARAIKRSLQRFLGGGRATTEAEALLGMGAKGSGKPKKAATFTLSVNPTFSVPLGEVTVGAVVRRPAIPVAHPGVRFGALQVTLAPDEPVRAAEARVEVGVQAGGMRSPRTSLPLKVDPKGLKGRMNNRLDGIKTGLERVLGGQGRVKTVASLRRGGLDATVEVARGPSGIPGLPVGKSKLALRYRAGRLRARGQVRLGRKGGRVQGRLSLRSEGDALALKGTARVRVLKRHTMRVTVEHVAGRTTISGAMKLPRRGFLRGGQVTASYRPGHGLTLEGTVHVGALGRGLIKPFDLRASYDATHGTLVATAARVQVAAGRLRMPGAKVRSVILQNVRYDGAEGTLSGRGSIGATLPVVGDVTLAARLGRGGGSSLEATVRRVPLAVPKASPLLTGSVGGRLRYAKGSFAGTKLTGRAQVRAPGLSRAQLQITLGFTRRNRPKVSATLGTPVTMGKVLKLQRLDVGYDGRRVRVHGKAGLAIPRLAKGAAAVGWRGGQLSAKGRFRLLPRVFRGSTVRVSHGKGGWSVRGNPRVSIPGLSSFRVGVSYDSGKEGGLAFAVPDTVKVKLPRAARRFVGQAEIKDLAFDAGRRAFSGKGALEAQLPMLGRVAGSLEVADNTLKQAALRFESNTIEIPAQRPVVRGTWEGHFHYGPKGFSGSAGADVSLRSAAFGKAGQAKLRFQLGLTAGGRVHGKGSLQGPVKLGKVLTLTELHGNLSQRGRLSMGGAVKLALPGVSEATAKVSYKAGRFSAVGHARFRSQAQGGRGKPLFDGRARVSYSDDKGWGIAARATIRGIPGLKTVRAKVVYADEVLTVSVARVGFALPRIHGLHARGGVKDLTWTSKTNHFSGKGHISVTLPALGTGEATIDVADSKIQRVKLAFDFTQIQIPRRRPVIRGSWHGDVWFEDGAFEETTIQGKGVRLRIPGFKRGQARMDFTAKLTSKGALSGKIKLNKEKEARFGKYLRLSWLEVGLHESGAIYGTGSLRVVNIPKLRGASVTIKVDSVRGVSMVGAAVRLPFGAPGGRFSGLLGAEYTPDEGLRIKGTILARIHKNAYVSGELLYSHKSQKTTVTASLKRWVLWDGKKYARTLVDAQTSSLVFSLFGTIGIFVEAGIKLGFNYQILPIVLSAKGSFRGFDLKTMKYEELSLTAQLAGGAAVEVGATPHLGVGACIGHPDVLSAQGGLQFPVKAKARVQPTLTGRLSYRDGKLAGSASVDLPVSFGVRAGVDGYAKVSALGDKFSKTWEQGLGSMTIMSPREIFRLHADLGRQEEDPAPPTLPRKGATLKPPSKNSKPLTPTGTRTEAKAQDPSRSGLPKDASASRIRAKQGPMKLDAVAKRGRARMASHPVFRTLKAVLKPFIRAGRFAYGAYEKAKKYITKGGKLAKEAWDAAKRGWHSFTSYLRH